MIQSQPDKATSVANALRHRIASGVYSGTGRLPSVRALAAGLGTSQSTVIAALRQLEEAGLVRRPPGRKACYLPECCPVTESAGGARRSEVIAADLRRRVAEGEFAHERTFPTAKLLRRHYRCSSKTVSESLRLLERVGMIARRGRSTLVHSRGGATTGASHVFLANEPWVVNYDAIHALEFVSTVEESVRARGWLPLRYLLLGEKGADQYDHRDLPDDHEIAGFIQLCIRKASGWYKFFAKRPHIATVLVVPAEPLEVSPLLDRHSRITYVMPDNYSAGAAMGRHLAELGHHRVAFLSHLPLDEVWAGRRLSGIRDALVGECVVPSPSTSPRDSRSRTRVTLEGSRIGGLPLDAARRRVAWLDTLGGIAESMEPQFESLLADRGTTCWVCVNDDMAAMACRFLEARHVQVPRAISVAGFDNSALGCGMGITSYDFGYHRMGSLAVQALAAPRSVVRDPTGTVRVTGHVIPRLTTGVPSPL